MLKTFRHLLSILTVCLLTLAPAFSQRGGGHGSSHSGSRSSSSKSSSSKSSAPKTVHVHGYYRKDGTYVPPYDRSASGAANSTSSSSDSKSTTAADPSRSARTRSVSAERDKHGKIKRSEAAKREFMRSNPCPLTGLSTGKCHGYVVDHIKPLSCGGADEPSNMQWQTVAEAKVKDRTERNCRRE